MSPRKPDHLETNEANRPAKKHPGKARSPTSSGGAASVPRPAPAPIVAIGASAGGLEALQAFFSAMPPDAGVSFVVVTHVRAERESMLPELLGAVTKMKVVAAGDSTPATPNQVVVARDLLLDISHGVMRPIKHDGHEASYHPIDHFFRSLANDQSEHAIGIILSGSGNDGSLGLKSIKAAGGMIMAQSPESAKYASMPENAIATHLADYVLAPAEMPAALVEYCCGPYLRAARREEMDPLPESAIQSILVRLRGHSGQDFTCYKKNTITRRIRRRMNVHRIDDAEAYLNFLRENIHEMDALMNELLISVTSFFRDPNAWQTLARDAITPMLESRDDDHPIRVWVPGCATGEEAYSVAMLLHEQIRKSDRSDNVQIFATDLDERAIDVARDGIYPEGISADVSPERLKTFFTYEDGAYRINKAVRDSIVFAQQNVISDPPFTRLDLIVCRNVLIYLDTHAQQHVLPTFHYALRPGGILFLGSAESVGGSSALFETISTRYKILRRKEVPNPLHTVFSGTPARRPRPPGASDEASRSEKHVGRLLVQLLLERFVPCSILVDDRGMIVHMQGRSGLFLEPEQGTPRNNVLEMAREGLGPPLGAALRQAAHDRREVKRNGVRVRTNGGYTLVDVTVTPLTQPETLRGMLLMTLQPSPAPAGDEPAVDAPMSDSNIELERELKRTRESLQSTVEELETSNEELKSSNEELQSTNEEMQSSNEELETSKEEMQSLNEELSTVNAELQGKVDALARTNDDMNNLLNSMHVATIFLDATLRVKRYTDQAREVVRLISSDIGRPLSDLTSRLEYPDLINDCGQVLSTLVPLEKEVRNTAGHWFLVRIIPYRTADNVIEGLVLTVIDVDRTKQAEESLRTSLLAARENRDIFDAMMNNIPLGITIAEGPDVTIRTVSRYGRELIGLTDEEVLGKKADEHAKLFDFYHADGTTPARTEELPLVRATRNGDIIRNEIWIITRRDGTQVPILCTAAPIRDAGGRITGGVAGWQDITDQNQAVEQLRRVETGHRKARPASGTEERRR